MAMRKIALPQDLKELAPMLSDSFQYPENPEWSVQEDELDAFVESFENISRSWWLVRAGQILFPSMRDFLPGFVWEEDGLIAGVVLLQQRGTSSNWVIGTVATRPEYRRRGIARKMVEAGIEFIREKNGDIAVLDVIDANHPAYQLYESLGFEHFTGNLDLEFKPEGITPTAEISPDYTLEKSSVFEWQPRFELSKRIAPENIQTYEPVIESRFRQPGYLRLVLPIILRAQKIRSQITLVRQSKDGTVVGYLDCDAQVGGKGRHRFSIRLDPAHAGLSAALLAYGLHHLTTIDPELVIEMPVPTWQEHVAGAAYELGFTKRLLYHRMGLRL
ncbi:MAG: GNAT family N-acetyltransferase [Anaerolineales bacterium]|jgi:ribosomal protein S18 acetylase RimI-like enzyme